MSGEVTKQAEVSSSDIQWINNRLDRMDKKLRIIIAVLVEKKMIGVALQKAIEESNSTEELIDWLFKELGIES